MKVLMVCIGNICRSPMAEGILQKYIDEYNLDWEVDSAATENYHIGESPHPLSQKACSSNGVDISAQKARKFKKEDLLRYDKIYVMAEDVLERVKKICGNEEDFSNVDYFLNELNPNSNASVPDPWYGTEEDYYTVFGLINQTCKAIVDKYRLP